jgi:2'-5' RNA ligase
MDHRGVQQQLWSRDCPRETVGQAWREAAYELLIFPEGPAAEAINMVARKCRMATGETTKREGEKPAIALAVFEAREAMEETLIRWIQRICTLHKRFWVTLNNFGGLPPGTLYLRVLDHEPFRRIAANLHVIDQYIQSCGHQPVKWPVRPHCSLAAGLSADQYAALLGEYARMEFHASFRVHSLVLMKKESRTGEQVLVNVFPLMP